MARLTPMPDYVQLPKSNGRLGWPWVYDNEYISRTMINGRSWPKISIVTPSYNQGDFLEETIRSVLMQGYPNLEYFVIDGGSTDGSIDILKKYDPWITKWVSEADRGQSHAINKGLHLCTGEWVAWLNSDDCYTPQGVFKLAETGMAQNVDIVLGSCLHFGVEKNANIIPHCRSLYREAMNQNVLKFIDCIDQPATMWRRSIFSTVGYLREDFQFVFDWEFFLRVSREAKVGICPDSVAVYRHHPSHKSGSGDSLRIKEYFKFYEENLTLSVYNPLRRQRKILERMALMAQAQHHSYETLVKKRMFKIILLVFKLFYLFFPFRLLPWEILFALGILNKFPPHKINKWYFDRFISAKPENIADVISLFSNAIA